VLEYLDGYAGSYPVRIGNAAHDQFQLDVYGEVLRAVEEYVDRGERLFNDTGRLVCRLADLVCRRWREPDNGMWEKRSARRHHVHAKVMAWAALDSACRIAEKRKIEYDTSTWKRTKEEIAAEVIARGFNRSLNSFVSTYDGEELDASLLSIARVGFLDGDDPRLLGTIDAIRRQLGRDELIYRYDEKTEDGLPPGEGAFLACSFWLTEALVIANRIAEAEDVFQKLIRRTNDLGLFSEEIDVESGRLIGNFPQALTHIGLMNAALRLQAKGKKKSETAAITSS
jgi:GH15 family glucan-1,4-alpha-glucosidase